MSAAGEANKAGGGVEAVDRALKLITCFTEHDGGLTLAQLSARTGFYKSTVLRLSASLERSGFLVRKADKTFALGPELMRLGVLYQKAFRLEDHVRPILRRMREEVGESATFYKRERDARICLFREDPSRSIRSHVPEGAIMPLDRGAAGRVLTKFEAALGSPERLAALIGELPFVSRGEWESELCSIAAPVFWAQPGLAGAVGLSGLITRFTPERIAEMTPCLLRGARDLSEVLGGGRYWHLARSPDHAVAE